MRCSGVVILKIFSNISLLFSLILFICACAACGMCYIIPCEEGEGLDVLFRVHSGYGFKIVVSSIIFLAHAGFCIIIANREKSEEKFGFIFGLTTMCALFALQSAAVWGSQASMVNDLINHYDESKRESFKNVQAYHLFSAICAFSSLLFILYTFMMIYLIRFKDELTTNILPPLEENYDDSKITDKESQSKQLVY